MWQRIDSSKTGYYYFFRFTKTKVKYDCTSAYFVNLIILNDLNNNVVVGDADEIRGTLKDFVCGNV